jgi:REP element-mobilizing transposase RayT
VNPSPLYTPDNCKFSYQLYWSLTLFWNGPAPSDEWLPLLKSATEADGVRVIQHRRGRGDCSLFLISTRPEIRPSDIAWSVKGRLQHLLHEQRPHAFQRNYDLRSVGSTNGQKTESYIASQLRQHPPVDARLLDQFSNLQIVQPEIDLLKPRFTAHGRFTGNLHLVFVHQARWRECRTDMWVAVREMIRKASSRKKHLLSRVGIVPDHLHLSMGIHPNDIPEEVALSYMNNIAYVHGMNPVLMYGCYMSTFGEYDMGAIKDC